ncbi:unnamed protein product [Dovyalis caffra]|uniref:Uncharacterized protein n=1 Tax=Dovyalis caffra TaxID=77055 RepID=A0AAV1S8U5_9ROSI|nr:unnamed protein product [Dovyalis caffra]
MNKKVWSPSCLSGQSPRSNKGEPLGGAHFFDTCVAFSNPTQHQNFTDCVALNRAFTWRFTGDDYINQSPCKDYNLLLGLILQMMAKQKQELILSPRSNPFDPLG